MRRRTNRLQTEIMLGAVLGEVCMGVLIHEPVSCDRENYYVFTTNFKACKM